MNTINKRTDGKTSVIDGNRVTGLGHDTPDIPASLKRKAGAAPKANEAAPAPKAAPKLGKPAAKLAPAKKDAALKAPATETETKAPAVGRGAKKDAAPAPKAEKAKGGVGRASAIDGKLKLTVVTKENPHREGTLAHTTYGFYKGAKTVQAFREACAANGGDANYLKHHIEKGHVTVG